MLRGRCPKWVTCVQVRPSDILPVGTQVIRAREVNFGEFFFYALG
jgi:hypothetical protein